MPTSKYLRKKSATVKPDLNSENGPPKHQCRNAPRQRSRYSPLQQEKEGNVKIKTKLRVIEAIPQGHNRTECSQEP